MIRKKTKYILLIILSPILVQIVMWAILGWHGLKMQIPEIAITSFSLSGPHSLNPAPIPSTDRRRYELKLIFQKNFIDSIGPLRWKKIQDEIQANRINKFVTFAFRADSSDFFSLSTNDKYCHECSRFIYQIRIFTPIYARVYSVWYANPMAAEDFESSYLFIFGKWIHLGTKQIGIS